MIANNDYKYMQQAIQLALQAEKMGNLPIGSVITVEDTIIAEGRNSILVPFFHPGRHAETEALSHVPANQWQLARKMTCFTTLEPCLMCMGTLLVYGIGKIVFGALDPLGGAGKTMNSLPKYFNIENTPAWIGPILPELCDPLYLRARNIFSTIYS